MDSATSTETKQIPRQQWEAWCETFTNGNRGRAIAIFVVEGGLDVASLVEGAALMAIDFDTFGKGNDFVIGYGNEARPSYHTISAPIGLMQVQDENGLVVSVEFEEKRGRRTIVKF
jgi:hypothetical protein